MPLQSGPPQHCSALLQENMEETDDFNGFHFSNQLICKSHRHKAELIKTLQKRNTNKVTLPKEGFPSLARGSSTGEPDTAHWMHDSSSKAGGVSPASEVIFDHFHDGYDTRALPTKASGERGCCSAVRVPSAPPALDATCSGYGAQAGLPGWAACRQRLRQPLASLPSPQVLEWLLASPEISGSAGSPWLCGTWRSSALRWDTPVFTEGWCWKSPAARMDGSG